MGYYDGYGYGYADYGPVTGYNVTTMQGDLQYRHAVYSDAYGHYYSDTTETRGGGVDVLNQYEAKNYGTDHYVVHSSTTTPLDGVYHSYGTRATYDYDSSTETVRTVNTYFDYQGSVSYFSEHDYASGVSISSTDTRTLASRGYYNYVDSTYSGPGGYSHTETGGYYYST